MCPTASLSLLHSGTSNSSLRSSAMRQSSSGTSNPLQFLGNTSNPKTDADDAGMDPRLRIGALYVLLYIRDDDPSSGWHWVLYYQRSEAEGWAFHINNPHGRWEPQHTRFGSDGGLGFGRRQDVLTARNDVVGLLRVGFAPPSDVAFRALQAVVNGIPLDAPATTCRTWVLDVLDLLSTRAGTDKHADTGNQPMSLRAGVDLLELERRILAWAARHHASAVARRRGVRAARPAVEDCDGCVLGVW